MIKKIINFFKEEETREGWVDLTGDFSEDDKLVHFDKKDKKQ